MHHQGVFLCSPDREFTVYGKYSGIDYHDCYWRAKKWIVKTADLPSMVETLNWFQHSVFGGSKPISAAKSLEIPDDDDDDDILEARIRSLREANLGNVASQITDVNELVALDLDIGYEIEADIDIEDITAELSDLDEKTDEAAGEMTDGDEELGVVGRCSTAGLLDVITFSLLCLSPQRFQAHGSTCCLCKPEGYRR